MNTCLVSLAMFLSSHHTGMPNIEQGWVIALTKPTKVYTWVRDVNATESTWILIAASSKGTRFPKKPDQVCIEGKKRLNVYTLKRSLL